MVVHTVRCPGAEPSPNFHAHHTPLLVDTLYLLWSPSRPRHMRVEALWDRGLDVSAAGRWPSAISKSILLCGATCVLSVLSILSVRSVSLSVCVSVCLCVCAGLLPDPYATPSASATPYATSVCGGNPLGTPLETHLGPFGGRVSLTVVSSLGEMRRRMPVIDTSVTAARRAQTQIASHRSILGAGVRRTSTGARAHGVTGPPWPAP